VVLLVGAATTGDALPVDICEEQKFLSEETGTPIKKKYIPKEVIKETKTC
jgi:hypothetical protein